LVPIASADLELAECDADLVGELRPAVLAYDERTDDERADDDGDGNRGNDSIDKSAMPLVNRKPDDAVPRTKNGRVRTKRRPPPTQTIPKATRDFVWARDHGRCCVPGCRATRNIAAHHIVFLSQGGDHDPSNIMLLCDGHHKILHTGVLVITGRAPDQLTFVRDGKRLIDPRSSMELEADHNLRLEAQRAKTVGVRARVTGRKRFDDVVTLEHAKQALMQLGFKARAARAALDAACAHVGADADVAMLVKAVLDLGREGPLSSVDSEDMRRDAMGALVGLGYSSQTATAAVELANAHVGAAADLSTLIKEALRRCAS
jgi:5-methylcytosine-specific restriction endonuclease McrA